MSRIVAPSKRVVLCCLTTLEIHMPPRTIGFSPPCPSPTDDTNGDGYLTRSEFRNFITELSNVGGNIKQLEAAKDGGCCWCLPLPQHDLFSYVVSCPCPHPLFFVSPLNDLRIHFVVAPLIFSLPPRPPAISSTTTRYWWSALTRRSGCRNTCVPAALDVWGLCSCRCCGLCPSIVSWRFT